MFIKCPECGKEVSDKAAACIHCGYPLAPQPEASPKWCPKCGTYHLAGVTQCNIIEPVSLDNLDEEIPKIQCPTCNSMERWITCPHCGNGFYSVNKPKCSHCKQEISIKKYAVDDDIVIDLNPILALLRNGQDHDARWAFRQQIGLKTLTSDEVGKHIQHIKVEYLRQMPYGARPYLERQKRTITKQDVIDIIGGLSFLIAVLAFIPAVICLTNEGLAFLSIIYLIFPVMTIIWFKLPSKYSRPKPKKPKENCCHRCGTVYPLTATECPTCGLTVKENNDRINKVKKP